MLDSHVQAGNRCEPHFARPPWTKESAEWRRIDEELPEDHIARRLVSAVERLDLQALWRSYSAGGTDALRPDLMLKVVLVEMWSGRRRPSEWFKDARENAALRWASLSLRPSRSSWYNFRDRLGPLVDEWFSQSLQMARQAGLTPESRGSLDGTFVAANASRHRLLNEARLEQRCGALQVACDCDNDRAHERCEPVPAWMATTPRTRLKQRERYDRARVRLHEFQAVNRRQRSTRRRPDNKIVVSVSEPEAAIGWDKENVFRPLYNVQLLSDLDSSLTLAYEVVPQNNDGGTLKPMLQLARDELHLPLSVVLCDSSYVTAANLATCDSLGVTLYGPWKDNDSRPTRRNQTNKQTMIPKEQFTWLPDLQQYRCPEGQPLTWIGQEKRVQVDGECNVVHRYRCSPQKCLACPRQASCTTSPARGRAVRRSEHEALIEALRARMAQDESRAVYRLRKQTVELGYADLKQNREFRRFCGHGLARVRTEVGLAELVHNLVIVETSFGPRAKTTDTPKIAYDDSS